ncbi:hypothetical protein CMUS01_05911 [Colletotrichum musicola]|uniref:Uncharacterized protein n=1 Tax=Colletotrichum musicola TaxID=2175873 RepID=A0A8H6KP53_9PEZI|nr:hypothetical protein CMUS01_05911 [Colletotrichum musicola]
MTVSVPPSLAGTNFLSRGSLLLPHLYRAFLSECGLLGRLTPRKSKVRLRLGLRLRWRVGDGERDGGKFLDTAERESRASLGSMRTRQTNDVEEDCVEMAITSERMGGSDGMEGTNEEQVQEQRQELRNEWTDGRQLEICIDGEDGSGDGTVHSPVRCRLSFDGADVRRNPDPSFFLGSFHPLPAEGEPEFPSDLLGQALPAACTCP